MFKKILIIAVTSLGILACGTQADFENYAGIEIEAEELRNACFEEPSTDRQTGKGKMCIMNCSGGSSYCSGFAEDGNCDSVLGGLAGCCNDRLEENPMGHKTKTKAGKQSAKARPDTQGATGDRDTAGPCNANCYDNNQNLTCADCDWECNPCADRRSTETKCN